MAPISKPAPKGQARRGHVDEHDIAEFLLGKVRDAEYGLTVFQLEPFVLLRVQAIVGNHLSALPRIASSARLRAPVEG